MKREGEGTYNVEVKREMVGVDFTKISDCQF